MSDEIVSFDAQAGSAREGVAGQSMMELMDQLPVKQHAAMVALSEGSSFPDAARAAGVGRATVFRWVKSDPLFRAAYNAWQQEVRESGRSRLMTMVDHAVDVVASALVRKDEKVAVKVLKELGVLHRPPAGETDPQLLQRQMDLRSKQREYRLDRQTLHYLLRKAGLSPQERREVIRRGWVHKRSAGREMGETHETGETGRETPFGTEEKEECTLIETTEGGAETCNDINEGQCETNDTK